jgi:serine/threonine protein kinase
MDNIKDLYTIKKIIGSGSYSYVYHAVDNVTGLEVGIKKISNKKYISSSLSIEDEINFLMKNTHPNILKFVNLHRALNNTFIITEYVKGKDLYDKIISGKMTEDYIKKIFIQLLKTLEFLHSKKYYHRDIKLENILVDNDDNIKLIDFGFVYKESEGEKAKNFPGSRLYASPELWKRNPDYYKTHDIWCAGIVLYIILYENLPFENDSDLEINVLYMSAKFPATISTNAIYFLEAILDKNYVTRPTIEKLLTFNWIRK